jgi:dTDP-4-amino-4,6-dideoxygalactose transaminase
MRLGAVPVFVDCDPVTWQIDPLSVQRAVTRRTRAIIGVHLYGQAFPVEEINALARCHDLRVIEDCAQSQGTVYRASPVGTLTDAGCFSFYPTKNLGACGQAGGVACADAAADRRIRSMRAQGVDGNGTHVELGYNMRMDGMQAAILSAMLPHLPEWNRRRAEIMGRYRAGIVNPGIRFQGELPHTRPAWYLAVVCVPDRPRFLRHMADRGINCGIHYRQPCHLAPAMAALGYRRGDLPNAENLADHCVSLPLYPELEEADVERVIEACNACVF